MTSIVSLVLLGLALVLGIILTENTNTTQAFVRSRSYNPSRFKESWNRSSGPGNRKSMPPPNNLTRNENENEGDASCRLSGRTCTEDEQCCSSICLHFKRCSKTSAF